MSDLISRRMMLDKMISRKSLFSTNQYEYMALSEVDKARADEIDNCIADLRNVPDAELERKKGHWVDTDNYYQRWKCSECGYHTRDAEPNYCPHCGADMRQP